MDREYIEREIDRKRRTIAACEDDLEFYEEELAKLDEKEQGDGG